MKTFKELFEKKLTPAELKKREEIAKAMERENPDMEMGKKMAIATAAAKRVAEEVELDEAKTPEQKLQDIRDAIGLAREKRKMKGQRVQSQREIDLQKKHDDLSQQIRSKSVVEEENQYMSKIEGGKGKGKGFGDKSTTVDDHLSAMNYHSGEYQKAMKEKRDSDARHHGMKYHKHKDQIERLGDVGNYRKENVDEANMSSDRSKRMFKSNELRHELGHEDKPMRSSAPAEPHSVHINGKKWKTFADKNHATNVANKIKGATVVKESEELDEINVMNRTSPVKRSNYVHSDKSATPGKDSGAHNVVDAAGKTIASYKNKMDAIDHANKKDEYRVKSIYEEVEIDEAKGALTYKQEHSKWGVIPKSKKEFVKFFPKNKEDDARSHAEKTGGTLKKIDQMGRSIREEVEIDEASDFHAQAMEHKKQSDAAMDKNDMEAYHHHMSEHHESMGQWHESKGRSSSADKEYEKAEKHHELSLKKSNQKNEGTEMLSFKYFQEVLEEAKKKYKESSAQIELAHGEMLDKDEDNGKEKKEMYVKEEQAPVAPVPGMRSKTHAIMVHPESKQRVRIERKNIKNYPASEGWKEVGFGMKLKEEVEELEEAAITHVVAKDKLAAHKEFMGKEGFDVTTKPLPKSHPKHATHVGIVSKNSQESSYHEDGNAHSVSESVEEIEEIEEISTATMGHAGKTTLKHIKNPGVQLRMAAHDVKPGIKGYRDRVALLKAADAEKKLKESVEEAASPFDWKAYSKERGTSADKKTKTFHDVKKTSTGTVYTKQVTPDGMSKGSGDDAAKEVEKAEAPKRGRGRPAGVGARTGSYKPRDPAAKAASAAKSAASKAANRAMRKESFDEEFMGSLIEGFEDEDFDDFLYCEEFDELDEATQEALINFINEKSCGSYKMKESLTGKQHKLDKNKNGKIDSHDFKLLRKEETEQIQESVTSYAAFLNKK